MPGPNGNNAQPTTNAEGKTYPWAVEGKDFASFRSMFYFDNMVHGVGTRVGREVDTEKLHQITEENDMLSIAEAETILGGRRRGPNSKDGTINVSNGFLSQPYSEYLTDEQLPEAFAHFEETKQIAKEGAAQLRNMYAGKTDAQSRRYQERANRYAEILDTAGEALDPRNGNTLRAEFDAPYLSGFNNLWVDFPRFEEKGKGFEYCVDIMDQAQTPGGRSIYDDYMTLMGAGLRETRVQQHRLQMEKDGWDADKERSYLNELRFEHAKAVEAFDNLWAVDDKGQYDKALGNPLDSTVGKQSGNNRDRNGDVGWMRGELQAIDMGYDSRHLYILGQLGAQEQRLKKLESGLRLDMEKAEPDKQKELQEKLEHIAEYRKDFEEIKDGVWGKQVNGREEMEAAGKRVEDFFNTHNEKYADLQSYQNDFKQVIEHNKEMAAKAPEITKAPAPRLRTSDSAEFSTMFSYSSAFGDGGFLEGGDIRFGIMATDGNAFKNRMPKDPKDKTKDFELTDEFDKKCKDMAVEALAGIDKYEAEHKTPEYPAAQSLREGLCDFARLQMEFMRDGVHYQDEEAFALNRVHTLLPQLGSDLFAAENIEKTEQALSDYPLGRYVKQGLEVHKLESDYKKKQAFMTEREKEAMEETIRGKKEDFLETAKDLHAKSLNPSPELLGIFGRGCLNSPTGFIGRRGLEALIDNYEVELAQSKIPQDQMDGLSKALDKFNTARSGFFKKESDEHKALREATETVQENLKQLKEGTVKTENGQRAMTFAERQELMAETLSNLEKVNENINKYIAHSEKDGKAPSTGAGKDRLEGAKGMKDWVNQLQDSVMEAQAKDQKRDWARNEKKAEKQPEGPKKEADKEKARKNVNLKELQEKEKKATAEKKGRKSVHEPKKRMKLDEPKKENTAKQKV